MNYRAFAAITLSLVFTFTLNASAQKAEAAVYSTADVTSDSTIVHIEGNQAQMKNSDGSWVKVELNNHGLDEAKLQNVQYVVDCPYGTYFNGFAVVCSAPPIYTNPYGYYWPGYGYGVPYGGGYYGFNRWGGGYRGGWGGGYRGGWGGGGYRGGFNGSRGYSGGRR